MDITLFYSLSSESSDSTFQVVPILDSNSNELFDYEHLLMGNFEGLKFPISFKHESGDTLCDIVDTGYVSFFLISEKLKKIFEVNDLTGWKIFPVRLFDHENKEIYGYHGLSIIGRCGSIEYKKCKIVEKQAILNGRIKRYYIGLYIGLDEWDGSDLFIPQKHLGIILTKKAANLFLENKISNARIIRLSDIETSESDLKILGICP